MSQPLLSMREGMYLAEEPSSSGAGPPAVSFYENDGILRLSWRQASTLLPVFGRCGPVRDELVAIEGSDLLGVERRGDHIRLLYAEAASKHLVKTPWLGGSWEALAGYVEAFCAPLRRNILLIVNPKSGTGHAMKLVEEDCLPLLRAAGAVVDVVTTEAPHHATRIIEYHEALTAYDVIISAGGDGTFHELLAGLLGRDDWRDVVAKTCLLQLPCGSGNALAASSGHRTVSRAAYAAVRGTPAPLDVVSIIQPSTQKRYVSFLSLTFGLIANLDIGTEHLRWMGAQRFVWGAVREILGQRTHHCRISIVGAEIDALGNDAPSGSRRIKNTGKYPDLRFLGDLIGEDGSVLQDSEVNTSSWEEIDGDFQLFSISNLPWLDMNFNLHPNSEEGSLNLVYCVGKQGVARGFQLMTGAERGRHVEWPWVHQRQIAAFRMDPVAEDSWLVVDGEAIERMTVYGELHEGLVRRLV